MDDEDSDEGDDGLADEGVGVVEVFLAMAIGLDGVVDRGNDAAIKRDSGNGTKELEETAHFLDGWKKMGNNAGNEEGDGKADGTFGKICICFEGLFCQGVKF